MRRHETIPRSQGIESGLAARVHDPLWLLARQWQFGELRAEDAASPAYVDVDAQIHLLDGWRPAGDADWRPYDPAAQPLERLVEQEPAAGVDPRLRLEGGLHLRRLLGAAGAGSLLGAFAAACPFPTDGLPVAPAQDGVAAAVRRRIPDGARLAATLARLAEPATQEAEAAALGLPQAQRATVADVAARWLSWWNPRVPVSDAAAAHPPAWDEHRLEYAFDVRASTLADTQLSAAGYSGGRLDWWAVDAPAGGDHAPPADAGLRRSLRSVPAPARFGGMPAPRFWEMEDARFDPGSIDAAPNDLGRLLLVSFATMYGNDWFALPLALPIGSLSRIDRFAVTDVFGRETRLGAAGAADDGWNLFGLTDTAQPRADGSERATSPWFLLAPALPDGLESAPVETVVFVRDEMANLAWAVEALVGDDAAGRLDRFGSSTPRPLAALPAAGAAPLYRVDTDVAAHWYPLAPEQLADRESVLLRLVPLARRIDGAVTTELPLGSLLASARQAGEEGVWLHEEEVPRAGITVVRTHQHARWHDGSVHAWTGRRKGTGPGEGTSGLRFDTVEP